MPKNLHGELARAAEREGVSLNRLIVMRLSGSLRAGEVAAAPARRSRLLTYALAANFLVLVGAAAAAIALLVVAYR
jgi:HicB-like protein involved in pilus formation